MDRPRALTALLLAVLAGCAVGRARAGTFRRLSVVELAATADACVVARVAESEVHWNETGDVIVTTFTVVPEEVLAGSVEPGPLLVHRVGGTLHGLTLSHDGMPKLEVGATAALFLRRRAPGQHVIAGLAQGAWRLEGERFIRDVPAAGGRGFVREALTAAELRRRVRAARPDGARP